MTKQKIMIRAVEKAIEGGFKRDVGESMIDFIKSGRINFTSAEGMLTVRGLLTEHQFAYALWGDDPEICTQCERHHETATDCDCGGYPYSNIKNWQFRLQKMVIASDPLAYVGSTLNEP